MAQQVFTNAYTYINSVDLSDHCKSMTLNYSAVMLDDTAMGDTTKSNAAGMFEWSVEIEYIQDYASAKVDATLYPLIGAAAFAIELRPANTTVAPENPKWTGNAVLESYVPVGGAVGDLLMTRATLRAAGTLTRATS